MKAIVSGVRARLAAKLGVCPFCVRTALYGALASWLVVAGFAAFWPQPLAPAVAVIVASAFSMLVAAHVAAHLWRVSSGLKEIEQEVRTTGPAGQDFAIGRRQFLGTVAKAGAAFTLIALTGKSFALTVRAQGGCANVSAANPVCADGGDDNTAIANLFAVAQTACDTLCSTLACAAGSKCLRNGAPSFNVFEAQCSDNALGGRTCCVRVECPCGCKSCQDGVPADTAVSGKAGNKGDAWSQMKANAEAACLAYCEKVDSCPPAKPKCKTNGTAKVEAKQNKDCLQTSKNPVEWTCTGKITNCPCQCRKK
jgi:hypothetical protein